MKLKKTSEPETIAPMPATGGTVIADRFKLDADAGAAPAAGKMGATIALVGALASLALLGVVAWLMYQNWELLQNA